MSKGILYMLIAMLLFSVMQVWVKQLDHIPFFELIFFRSIISLVLSVGTIQTKGLNYFGHRKDLLIGRAIFGMLSLSCFYYAIQNMPLGSLITIVNIKPFLVLLWASLFLSERVRWFQWVLFTISFGGIFWLKGIDGRIETLPLLATLGAALFASIAHTFVRKLKDSDSPIVILFYFTLVTTPIFAPLTYIYWVTPVGVEWLYCLGIGLLTHFAQLLLTKAYQIGQIAVVSNMYYLGIVFAFGFGFMFFGETYSTQQLYAVGLIVLCLISNIVLSNRKKKLNLNT